MKVHVRAPNRIDLSGGTLDIYPLYIFEGGGYTVNAAIDLWSEITLEPRNDKKISVHSFDLNETVVIDSLDTQVNSTLDFILSIIRFYPPHTGVNVYTRNHAPKGSGLGASSALLIALSYGLNYLNATHYDGETLIRYGADLEASQLLIPTGKQDYYPALYGGINALHFDIRGIRREAIHLSLAFLEQLNDSLVLSFTGESHFSGTSNWNMMKAYIENLSGTRDKLTRIKHTSEAMKNALKNEDFENIIHQLKIEWENRKSLAEGVTTPQLETMIEAAHQAGALASKVCGAGGGGCMLTLCLPSERKSVIKALEQTGATILNAAIVPEGIRLNVE